MDTEAWFEDALAREEARWRAGDFRGLVMAFMLMFENGRPLPEWLGKAVATELSGIYTGNGARKKGGMKPALAAFHNQRHVVRWSLARRALAGRSSVAGKEKAWLKLAGYADNQDGAFQWASDQLKGAPARGSRGAIETSYKLVNDAIAEGNGALYGIVEEAG